MNAKKAKALRRGLRANGLNPKEAEYQYGRTRALRTATDRIVLVPDSPRSVYRQMKKLEK